jgi:uncharacterized membrane protein
VLLVLLIADSLYLTWVHYQPAALVCGLDGGCHTVQASKYSSVAGIPVALLGLGMYLALLGLAVARFLRPGLAPVLTVGMVGALVGAVVYYGYLTWLEFFVIHAVCQWCVIGAVLTVALLVVEGIGLVRLLAALGE